MLHPNIPKPFIAILVAMLSMTISAAAQTYSTENASEMPDSLDYGITMLSDEEEEVVSLFDGVIPPTPQAAALARYAEYPVGHATGLPDISIPLYEIRVGGFTLPISISYHNAGARCDEIETSLGLGWSLRAGGAVTRTVQGAPDLEYDDYTTTDFTYRELSAINHLTEYDHRDSTQLEDFVTHKTDTESDRYTFRAGNYSGTFRYDHKSKKFVILEQSGCIISAKGCGWESSFRILCPDNTVYTYSAREGTGVDERGENLPSVTAWYVSQIETPWGDIKFEYESDIIYSVRRDGSTYTSGELPYVEPASADTWAMTYFDFWLKKEEYRTNYIYRPILPKSIEWNGNRVEFLYDASGTGPGMAYGKRLASMKVVSTDGEIVKAVAFGNAELWTARDAKRARRVLRTLTDSQEGIYSFDYHDDIRFPDATDRSRPADYSDLWGFWCGSVGLALTPSLADWIRTDKDGFQHRNITINARSRIPSLEYTRAGVLKKITFPTGGSLTYEYELNSGGGRTRGGLRVAGAVFNDGDQSKSIRYSYDRIAPVIQEPEDMMRYRSSMTTQLIQGWCETKTLKTVLDSPVSSAFFPNSSVTYTRVRETWDDGGYTDYVYDAYDYIGYSANTLDHPSTYPMALVDRGNETPVLVEKTTYGSDGTRLRTERHEYMTENIDTLRPGVRIVSVFTFHDSSRGTESLGFFKDEGVSEENLQRRETMAIRHVRVPIKETVIDEASGYATETIYDYDSEYRTILPISVTASNSDGTSVGTEYEYPFTRTDQISRSMTSVGLTDTPVATRRFLQKSSEKTLLSESETEFSDRDGYFLPFCYRSWMIPTTDDASQRNPSLNERERVTEYNALGRPIGIIANETDRTDFTWDSYGYLESYAAPGGLTTTYTHRPQFGVASIKLPNGQKTTYDYNTAGMLSKTSDDRGTIETYAYSIMHHGSADMTGDGNAVTTRRWLDASGTNSVVSRQYHDGLGRPTVSALGGANTSGKYLYSSVTYDSRGREAISTLAATGSTAIGNLPHSSVLSLAKATYSDNYPYSETIYDGLDRPVSVSTPGDAWHSAGKAQKTEYVTNRANSVRLYSAPVTSISLVKGGYYAAGTLSGVRTIDEDGNEMTVYSDKLGRKVLERRGPESEKGKNDTYFVNNALGQLRYVISPEYENAGYKDKYVYEYRYDSEGNVVKKIIPDAGMTQYWYDRAGRMAFMQDETLRERGLHRFFLYDRAGRMVIQGTTPSCSRGNAVNFASFTGQGGFAATGYTLDDDIRIKSPSIETVSYYDSYGFVSCTDTRLALIGITANPADGMQTGAVEYCSDGSRTMTAIYYDRRGNVAQTREITPSSDLRVTTNRYGYADELLSTKTTENGMTVLTENVYDAASGLVVATDVTINGTKSRVSQLTYDDRGRVVSIGRGLPAGTAAGSGGVAKGGTVGYTYDMHGKTTSIRGPAFSQNLYYADGPGKRLYNGSISAMSWTMGTDPTVRGYRYTYNPYGWLTLAEYGETERIDDNKNRFTERISEYSLNGMPKRLQRHGLKADGVHGKIDNLHIYLDGNRIDGVLEDAAPVTTPGSMDFAGKTDRISKYGYNSAGALTMDESRGITSIEYDNSGHPVMVSFSPGSATMHVYTPSGARLKTVSTTAFLSVASADMDTETLDPGIAGAETTEYRGNAVWRNGKVERVLFPGGYATLAGGREDGEPTFHYYTTDYLGNVRAVINGTTGETEQTVAYYPFGSVISTLGSNRSLQPYKFGGKELLTANGLNEYDFGARSYVPMIPAFTSTDPLCEKHPELSTYLYCGNDPINSVDPTGLDIWDIDQLGNVVNYQFNKDYDMLRMVDDKNKPIDGKSTSRMRYGSVHRLFDTNIKDSKGCNITVDGFKITGDEYGTEAFEFLADNTSVEWSHAKTGNNKDFGANYLFTSHLIDKEYGMGSFVSNKSNSFKNLREYNHSHPGNTEYPSGSNYEYDGEIGDVQNAAWIESSISGKPVFNIYIPIKKKYISYTPKSKFYEYISTYKDLWK